MKWSLALIGVSVLASGCDPIGWLRVYVVEDSPGEARTPVSDAHVWMECPESPGQRYELEGFGGGHSWATSESYPGRYLAHETPALRGSCVVVIERAGCATRRYRVEDLCVDDYLAPTHGRCAKAFLYAVLTKADAGS
jgi:hypothetical protein